MAENNLATLIRGVCHLPDNLLEPLRKAAGAGRQSDAKPTGRKSAKKAVKKKEARAKCSPH